MCVVVEGYILSFSHSNVMMIGFYFLAIITLLIDVKFCLFAFIGCRMNSFFFVSVENEFSICLVFCCCCLSVLIFLCCWIIIIDESGSIFYIYKFFNCRWWTTIMTKFSTYLADLWVERNFVFFSFFKFYFFFHHFKNQKYYINNHTMTTKN